jgi:O-antigen/teichoic acid export membrane protein
MNIIKKLTRGEFTRHFLTTTVANASFWGGRLVLNYLIAWKYSSTVYGEFSYALIVATMVQVLLSFGIPSYLMSQDKDSFDLNKIIVVKVVLAFIAFAGLTLLYIVSNNPFNWEYAVIYFMHLVVLSFNEIIYALNRVKGDYKSEIEQKILDTALLLVVTGLVMLSGMMIQYILVSMLFVQMVWLVWNYSKHVDELPFGVYESKITYMKLIKRIRPFSLGDVSTMLYQRVTGVLVGNFLAITVLASYNLSFQLMSVGILLLNMSTLVVLPKLSQARINKKLKDFIKLQKKYIISVIGIGVIMLLLMTVAGIGLDVLYDNKYENLVLISTLMALGFLLKPFTYAYGNSLTALDKQSVRTNIQIVVGIVSIIVGYFAIITFGVVGAIVVSLLTDLTLLFAYKLGYHRSIESLQ